MVNILFVCSGDTCRSPIISAIFNDEIKKMQKETLVKASSAGIFVNSNDVSMSDDAKYALSEFNILHSNHTPTALSLKLIKQNQLVICVNSAIKNAILNKEPNAKNVVAFSDYIKGAEIADPFGLGRSAYLELCKMAKVYVIKLINILNKEGII